MKPDARRAFGTPPASGSRHDPRSLIGRPATLHVHGAEPRAVTIADCSLRGCRVLVASDLPAGAHLALVPDGGTLGGGRVAWNDGAALGVDFCAPLLSRVAAGLQVATEAGARHAEA